MKKGIGWGHTALGLVLIMVAGTAAAARISDVRGTKHNLSAAPDSSGYIYIDPATGQPATGAVPARTVKASTETQVCVFCHTPHGSTTGLTPLWNRRLSTQDGAYTRYSSSTLDAIVIQNQLSQPNGTSKLCLSCHDGSIAIGNVNVLNGTRSTTAAANVAMTGTAADGTMPPGPSGETSGFTRRLGADLSNDHPISFDFTDQVSVRDGELRRLTAAQRYPADGSVIGIRAPGFKPRLPLEPTGTAGAGQMQCGTCHDPHVRETNALLGNQKFLRQSRFQVTDPTTLLTATYTPDQDIICIGCHEKNITPGVWAFSAHANPAVANETYTAAAAAQREFPTGMQVWQAACLNCHDTHTVQGARRLLREGTDSTAVPKQGGASAIEETCYQCHNTATGSALGAQAQVPDIRTDFQSARRMPIAGGVAGEVHEISASFTEAGFVACASLADAGCGADFLEPRSRLGVGNLANRHAECTDCHNPHRVVKFQTGIRATLAGAPEKAGTHRHEDAAGFVHSNVISGVLRGGFGVEPVYPSPSFHDMPTTFLVKRGDPGANVDTAATASYATREYQICLKCHSNYGYNDDNAYPNSSVRPQLGGLGLTPANANGHANFTSYTNQAKEFQGPTGHQGPSGGRNLGFDGGAGASAATAATNNNNHRSWHPVMAPTGRTNRAGAFLAPWNNTGTGGQAGRLGVQTMYCSDCHGSNTNAATAVPVGNTVTSEDGAPWGPHGSANNFLLKGTWDTTGGEGNANTVCFKCHAQAAYSGGGGTGFQTDKGDGHTVHSDRIDTPLRCNFCHVAVPHGWKNRSLLVNLNDVGPEAGLARGTSVTFQNNVGYTNGPYYRRAFLRVTSFPTGQWTENSCNGGRDAMKTQCEAPN